MLFDYININFCYLSKKDLQLYKYIQVKVTILIIEIKRTVVRKRHDVGGHPVELLTLNYWRYILFRGGLYAIYFF